MSQGNLRTKSPQAVLIILYTGCVEVTFLERFWFITFFYCCFRGTEKGGSSISPTWMLNYGRLGWGRWWWISHTYLCWLSLGNLIYSLKWEKANKEETLPSCLWTHTTTLLAHKITFLESSRFSWWHAVTSSPHEASGQWKNGCSELRCAVSAKYPPDFEN